MTWQEAVDILSAGKKYDPYRNLCAEEHPQHEIWRARVIARATGQAVPVVAGRPESRTEVVARYPSLATQAGNAIGAIGRVAGAIVRRDRIKVSEEEYARRLTICEACDQYDAAARRCRVCGCYSAAKLRLATERCPLNPPKWDVVEPEVDSPPVPD